MQRYQEKQALFHVPEPDGSSLSPVTAAVYLFLTMIIVLQVTAPGAPSSFVGTQPWVPRGDRGVRSSLCVSPAPDLSREAFPGRLSRPLSFAADAEAEG